MLSWLPCTAYQGIASPAARNGRRAAASAPGTSGKPYFVLGRSSGPRSGCQYRSSDTSGAATPSYRCGSPESGTTVTPSSRSIYALSSLSWQLSVASPVTIAKSTGAPENGARAARRTARTIASATWKVNSSCAR